jgi:hypothetical protein
LPTINASTPDPVETSLTKTGETENQSRRDNCVTSGSADDKEKGRLSQDGAAPVAKEQ